MGSGESLSRADGAGMTMAARGRGRGCNPMCATPVGNVGCAYSAGASGQRKSCNCGIFNTVARKLVCRDGTRVMGPISLMPTT